MMNNKMRHCAIIILAAGTSSRMGSPKQILPYKGKTLLRHAVDTALETDCQSVFVVLGANSEMLRKEMKDRPVIIVENTGWQEGMASSIRCGLKNIMNIILRPDSVIFMVCDQPFVTSSLLLSLVEKKQETGLPIVACSYEDKPGDYRVGIPALFHKSFFPALMELKGDKGARKLIIDNRDKVATVPFPGGIIDIDTAADYELLKNKNDN
jgi:molybdenum cofactor cytidylyltransferase